jgi:hypothetical protein
MPSQLAMRVLCILTGLWLGADRRCLVRRAGHVDRCRHHFPVRFKWRSIAAAVFGHKSTGGRQIDAVREALIEIAETTTVLWEGRHGYFFERWSHILSWQEVRHAREAVTEFRWDPYVLDSLLAGHFQEVPPALVRLPGTAFRFWLVILAQWQVAKHRESRVALTGPEPAYILDQLGVARTRTDRLEARLRAYVAQGNAVQTEFEMRVERRASSGLNVVVKNFRKSDRGTAGRGGQGVGREAIDLDQVRLAAAEEDPDAHDDDDGSVEIPW